MGLRREKLNSIFLKEICDIIRFSLKDPHIGFVTVMDVDVTNDLGQRRKKRSRS